MGSKHRPNNVPFFVEVARGVVPGFTAFRKFGRTVDIDAGQSEDIWTIGGTRTWLASGEALALYSSSASDTATGTGGAGARTILVQGLAADYSEISETVNLEGTATVTTSNAFFRVHLIGVETVGTIGSNKGTIGLYPALTGTDARQGEILPGVGQSQVSHYTIPASRRGLMVQASAGAGAGDGAAAAREGRVMIVAREEGGAFLVKSQMGIRSDGGVPDMAFAAPLSFPEKTDIMFQAESDVANSEFYVQYTLILEETT